MFLYTKNEICNIQKVHNYFKNSKVTKTKHLYLNSKYVVLNLNAIFINECRFPNTKNGICNIK